MAGALAFLTWTALDEPSYTPVGALCCRAACVVVMFRPLGAGQATSKHNVMHAGGRTVEEIVNVKWAWQ